MGKVKGFEMGGRKHGSGHSSSKRTEGTLWGKNGTSVVVTPKRGKQKKKKKKKKKKQQYLGKASLEGDGKEEGMRNVSRTAGNDRGECWIEE